MESLSKVPFYVPLIVYIPVIIWFIWKSLFSLNLSALTFSAYVTAGFAVWSFIEYFLHRFVFHFHPTSDWAKRIHFIFHGVHHDFPNDAGRLVMPPSASLPLASLFFLLFYVILGNMAFPLFCGFITGYLIYDMVHYALHHATFKSGFWKKLKKHHMLHHYSDDTKGYGVTSDFWDKIFRSDFIKK
ncbi:sterol desaturase family protein [Hufsiella ginkgonis]|nr:sterol desaturase family protein [Hufsiella ginkgonis]